MQTLQLLSLCAKRTLHYSRGNHPTKGLWSSELPAAWCVWGIWGTFFHDGHDVDGQAPPIASSHLKRVEMPERIYLHFYLLFPNPPNVSVQIPRSPDHNAIAAFCYLMWKNYHGENNCLGIFFSEVTIVLHCQIVLLTYCFVISGSVQDYRCPDSCGSSFQLAAVSFNYKFKRKLNQQNLIAQHGLALVCSKRL